MKPRLLIICGLLAAGAGAFFFLNSGPDQPPASVHAPRAAATPIASPLPEPGDDDSEPDLALAESNAAEVMTREVPDPEGGDVPLLPALVLDKGELPWEASIRKILETKGVKESDLARRLFELMPGMPVEGRQTAAEEAIQRTPTADYNSIALPVLANPNTYPPSMVVLFSDLMERPDPVRLPALLAIARNQSHPFFNQARENLEFVTGKEFGTDWAQWDAAIRAQVAAGKN